MTDVVGVGVIGCGNVATHFHLPAYLARPDSARVVALADLSTDRLGRAAAIAGVPPRRSFTDYADLLACPDVEIVDICAPQHFHAQIARAAAAAGKHILCEKPIATVPADAQAILDSAHAAGVTVGVMHNYLFYPEYMAARQVLDSGEIGAVRLAIVNYLGVPDVLGAGETAKSWRHDPIASGGGVLIDMVHALYVAEHLLGHQAQRVSAYVAGNEAHSRVEATALCRIETDGPPALVNVGWGIGPGGVFVEGSRGSLEIRWRNGGTNPFEPLEWIEVRTSEGTRRLALPAGLELFPLVIEGIGGVIDDFVDAVATGRAPTASGADGMHALELVLGAYKSAAIGQTVSLPLETADPVYIRGVAAIPTLGGPSWSPVLRQRLYTTD